MTAFELAARNASPMKDVCTLFITTLTEPTEEELFSAIDSLDSDQRISLENQINELGLKIDAFAAERRAIVQSVGLAPLEVEPSLEVRTSIFLGASLISHSPRKESTPPFRRTSSALTTRRTGV